MVKVAEMSSCSSKWECPSNRTTLLEIFWLALDAVSVKKVTIMARRPAGYVSNTMPSRTTCW